MHLEILVEEPSAEAALNELVPKLAPGCSFKLHAHQGKHDLLARLPAKLGGYAKWLPADYRIVILLDEDRQDCVVLKERVLAEGRKVGLSRSLLCRIAVEELESWFLGDVPALMKAYPGVPPTLGARRKYRDPDKIAGGTWEALERVLQDAGYFKAGLAKIAAARALAPHMNVEVNTSRSFRTFRDGLRRLTKG